MLTPEQSVLAAILVCLAGALGTLLVLLIAAYAVGLLRAWQLLGATHHGAARQLLRRLRNLEQPRETDAEAGGVGTPGPSGAHR